METKYVHIFYNFDAFDISISISFAFDYFNFIIFYNLNALFTFKEY